MKKSKVLALALAAGLVLGGQAYAEGEGNDVDTNTPGVTDQAGKDQAGKDQEGKDQEGKDQEGKDQEGKDQEGKDQEGKDQEGKDQEGKGQEGKDQEGKEETNETGYSTKEAAEAAAKKALEKDPINNMYEVSENDGKFFYKLSIKEVEVDAPKEEEEETKKAPYAKYDPKATEKTFNFDLGFKTEEEAIKQAEALVKNSEINKGYNVTMGADGRYYIQLSPLAEKTKGLERKPVEKAKETKEVKTQAKANTNVKTGVAGLTGVVATLAAASAAMFASKRK